MYIYIGLTRGHQPLALRRSVAWRPVGSFGGGVKNAVAPKQIYICFTCIHVNIFHPTRHQPLALRRSVARRPVGSFGGGVKNAVAPGRWKFVLEQHQLP